MLTSTNSRSPPPRATHTPHSPPPISYPVVSPRPFSQTTITAPAKTLPRGHRPSISNTMHWLSRTSTQSSTSPYAPSKPTRISEPKLVRSIELLSQQRSGVLGSGATIVRTPDEALRDTGVRLTFDTNTRDEQATVQGEVEPVRSDSSDMLASEILQTSASKLPSPVHSPPLPPLPLPEEEESQLLEGEPEVKLPPRPTRAPPPVPTPSSSPSPHSSLKPKHALNTNESPFIPSFPVNPPAVQPPPVFRPVLMSEVPTGAIDVSKIVITLETCAATYRTTLDTIKSRPSHLFTYISSLFPRPRSSSTASSIYSTASDDMSTYRHHLTSQGLLTQAFFNVHIFLDRPSAPYAHILNYLRSPIGTPAAPETLPRAVQLESSSLTRLEGLLELRDEAVYLNLEGLHKLCTDEIRLHYRPRLHTPGYRASIVDSVRSLHASVYSLHTLLERVENDMHPNRRDSHSSDNKSKESCIELGVLRSPPTPQSWNGHSGGINQRRHSPPRSPPAGWI